MPRSLDTIDIVIVQMLLADSRRPDSHIAKFLELDESEIARRIASLRDDGIIRNFVTRVQPAYLRAINVFIFGTSEIDTLDEARDRLSRNDESSWVGLAGGSRIYVAATLRRLMHLDSYVQFLREELGMKDATFGIRSGLPTALKENPPLEPIDYRILASLRRDSRKGSSAVGQETGADSGVVESRIQRMRDEGAVEFSIELDPGRTSDLLCMVHLWRRGRGELKPFMRQKLNEHSPRILFFNQYRNLTDLTVTMCWVSDMEGLRAIISSFRENKDFYHIESNPLLNTGIVGDWTDRLVVERARDAEDSVTESAKEVA